MVGGCNINKPIRVIKGAERNETVTPISQPTWVVAGAEHQGVAVLTVVVGEEAVVARTEASIFSFVLLTAQVFFYFCFLKVKRIKVYKA